MTQSSEPNEDRRIDRQLRTIARRVNRLEDTQVTWGELNRPPAKVRSKAVE